MTSESSEPTELSDSSEVLSPLRYDLVDFRDSLAHTLLQQNIDPNNTLKAVKVDFRGDKVREFYWRYIFKDVESSKSTTELSNNLLKVYEALDRTKAVKNLGITFEPEDQDTVRVVIEPQYAKRTAYGIIHSHLTNCFGLIGMYSLKNITGLLDDISLNLIKGTYGDLNKAYFMTYLLPVLHKDYSFEFSAGRKSVSMNRSVSEDSAFQVLRFFTNKTSFQLAHSQRWNIIDPIFHSKEVASQDIYPNRELSFSASRLWPILDPNKNWGNVVQLKRTVGVVEGAGTYVKEEFVSHALLHSRYFDLKGRLREICFENHLALGLVFPLFKSKLKMNDRFYRTDLPGFSEIVDPAAVYDRTLHPNAGNQGFEFLGDYKGDDMFLKNTFKIDFKECPILHKANIVPFLYMSYGYFSGDFMNNWIRGRTGQLGEVAQPVEQGGKRYKAIFEEVKKKSRFSVGIGLFRTINSSYNFEALLNLYSIGTASDKLARFQLRFTINE